MFFLLTLALALPLFQEAGGVTRVRIEGALDVGTQALLRRAIDEADGRGDRLVLELDTPGGEIELMWQLKNALLAASERGVATSAWVDDRALSAGALLALACERVYMRSHATLGSALPVSIGPGGLAPVSEDEEVREKLSSAMRAEFRGVAERHGRPGILAEAMVDPELEVLEVRVDGALRLVSSTELDDLRARAIAHEFLRTVVAKGELFNATGSEAVALGLADGLAETREELFGKLGLAGARETVIVRARSEDLAAWLVLFRPLLLIAGFVFLYLELKTPGFGLPGTLGLLCFALLLGGQYMVGLADIPHVILIMGGAALVAVELFLLPGTLWLGLVGACAILGGLIWSFVGTSVGLDYGLDRAIVMREAWRVFGSGFAALLVVWGLARVLPHTPLLRTLVASPPAPGPASAMPEASGAHAAAARVGATGRALTALRPVGKVVLDGGGELDFEARSDGPELERGARVRVVEVQPSGRLVVELAPESGGPA